MILYAPSSKLQIVLTIENGPTAVQLRSGSTAGLVWEEVQSSMIAVDGEGGKIMHIVVEIRTFIYMHVKSSYNIKMYTNKYLVEIVLCLLDLKHSTCIRRASLVYTRPIYKNRLRSNLGLSIAAV